MPYSARSLLQSFLRNPIINSLQSLELKGRHQTNLSTEGAGISRVLRYFHLFNLLTQGGTITLSRAGALDVSYTKQLCPLTVPYLPVIPTFFVRFVYMQILRTVKYTDA